MTGNTQNFDVAVVGAGPAGSLLGYYLASSGASVLILDKKRFPRYKACGGGITRRALMQLPFDITEVVEDYTIRPRMLWKDRDLYSKPMKKPIIAMVMRDRFDHFLLRKAMEKGARYHDNTLVKSVRETPEGVMIRTDDNGLIRASFVAGADGVHSRVANQLNLKIKSRYMTAIEGEVYPSSKIDLERFSGSAHYDFGVIPRGYGWVFPKKDHLSVGVGTFQSKISGLNRYFMDYCRLKRLNIIEKITPFRGHQIPVSPGKKNRIASDRGLLLGDAAGYCDPLTGEGLYFAFKSARIASETLFKGLSNEINTLVSYTDEMTNVFYKDSLCATAMAGMVYAWPLLGEKILKAHAADLAQKELDIVSGNFSYTELGKYLLKKLLNPNTVISTFT